jgi:molybdenum cofactor synthesis domain-containing protein
MTKTAGILIIGNEILSGKVRDENAYFLAKELRELGIDLRRISVIPDQKEIIGSEVVLFSASFDYVFTSGGVGPTHDDITMAAIAEGFGVDLRSNEIIRRVLLERLGKPANEAVLKMTLVPEGAKIIEHENMRFPVVSFRNVYIFPGIPDYLRNKFITIREMFRLPAFYLKKIFLDGYESDYATILNEVVIGNPDVMFGSYPVPDMKDYSIIITVESKSESRLGEAVEELLNKLPQEAVVRIE